MRDRHCAHPGCNLFVKFYIYLTSRRINAAAYCSGNRRGWWLTANPLDEGVNLCTKPEQAGCAVKVLSKDFKGGLMKTQLAL